MLESVLRRRNARYDERKRHSWEMTVPAPWPSTPPTIPYGPETETETEVFTVTVTAQRQLPTDFTIDPRPWTTRIPPNYGPNGVHYSDKTRLISSPTPIQSQPSGSLPSATTSTDPASSSSASSFDGRPGPPLAVKAAAGVIAVLLLCVGGILLFLFLRKRKRRQQQQQQQQGTDDVQTEQIKTTETMPFFNPGPTPVAGSTGTGGAPPVHPRISQPVILGPIVPDANGAYNTGIDTSDMVSLRDEIGIENPFADPVYHPDEPPPPYRPRSVAPLSRDTSLRENPAMGTGRRVEDISGPGNQSPFDDTAALREN